MKSTIFFMLLVLTRVAGYAQLSEHVVIPAGDSISNHYSYLFPSFKEARVKFRDGRSFTYKMDFNMLICEMQYINAKGDTLEITNPELVDSIVLDSSSFIYDYQKGYFQIVAVSDAASLAVYRRASFQPVPKGGMGENRQDGGIQQLNLMNTRQGSRPLVMDQDINAIRTTSYLLVLKGGDMENAEKAAFIKIYTGDKKSFDQYVKTNKINFKEQADLKKLFNFCTESKI